MSDGKKPVSQLQISIYEGRVCPYCKCLTKYVSAEKIYGKGVKDYGMLYWCQPCDAYVGCHKGTDQALGRLAKWDLRRAKKDAHAAFDPIWKLNYMTRAEAYLWLAQALQIDSQWCHIGMFNTKTCNQVTTLSNRKLDGFRPNK